MAFKFVRGAGANVDPAVVSMYGSGVIHSNGVVVLETPVSNDSAVLSRVAPGGSGTRTTSIFGISLDYAQGASDTLVRVIPVLPGMLFEADAVNAWGTVQAGKFHQLYDDLQLNNTSYNHTGGAGVFLVYNVVETSGSIKVIGEFVRAKITPQSTVGT